MPTQPLAWKMTCIYYPAHIISTTQLAKMSTDPEFVELTADVLEIFFYNRHIQILLRIRWHHHLLSLSIFSAANVHLHVSVCCTAQAVVACRIQSSTFVYVWAWNSVNCRPTWEYCSCLVIQVLLSDLWIRPFMLPLFCTSILLPLSSPACAIYP